MAINANCYKYIGFQRCQLNWPIYQYKVADNKIMVSSQFTGKVRMQRWITTGRDYYVMYLYHLNWTHIYMNTS